MASTYSSRLRLQLPGNGDLAGTWGSVLNDTLGNLMEQAIAGHISIALADANTTLTALNGLADQARYAMMTFTGALTAQRDIIVPTTSGKYIINNATTGGFNLLVKTAAGTGIIVAAGQVRHVWCNGSHVFALGVSTTPSGGLTSAAISGNLSVAGFSTFGTAGGPNPVFITAGAGGGAIEIRGRAGDGLGLLRFTDSGGTVEYGRLQATLNQVALSQGPAGVTSVFTTNAAGDLAMQHAGSTVGTFTAGTGLTVAAGNATVNGDITATRPSAPTTGALFLGNTGTRYLFFDGANYALPGGALFVNGSQVWTAGNFTPTNYALLSGAAFTGSISVTGAITSTGVVTCLSPSGIGSGRAWVNDDNRFGSFSWNDGGAFIAINVDGTGRGIVTFGSDERLKTDIMPTGSSALVRILDLDFIDFRFRPLPGAPEGYKPRLNRGGISAQQAQRVDPGWVDVMPDKEGTLSLNAPILLTNALQAITELAGLYERAMVRIAALEARD